MKANNRRKCRVVHHMNGLPLNEKTIIFLIAFGFAELDAFISFIIKNVE